MSHQKASPDTLSDGLWSWSEVFMRHAARDMHAAIRRTGLSHSQLVTLLRLHHRSACPISELGEGLDMSTAGASHMVDRMVEQGLLARLEDRDDRRVRRITLTPTGDRLVVGLIEARREWMRRLTSALTPAQMEEVMRALAYLSQAARRVEAEEMPLEAPG